MKRTCTLSVFAFLFCHLSAYASESGTDSVAAARMLDEIVVTDAAKTPSVALLPLDVRIVDSSVIDKSTETNLLPVLQNRIPGMFVTERGLAGFGVSGGAAGAVSIRGVGGNNKVLFLIDGQPQWAGVFGHSLPDTYVTNDVSRVEVVSGPSSLLYGSGAMGGSVNLITRRAEREGFSGSVRAQGGSYASQKYGAKAGYRNGGFRAFGAASYESTRGSREGMGYWLANQYASLSYEFNPHWEAGANGMLTETKADNAGSIELAQPLGMWSKMFRTTASIFVKNRYSFSSGGLQAYYNWGKHEVEDGLRPNGTPRDYLFHSRDYNAGITAYQTLKPLEGMDISLGVDFKHWGGRAYNTAKADGKEQALVNRHVNEIAAYLMAQQALFNDILSLNAGARLEHSSQFGNQWVPQAGFVLRPLHGARMKFSYGRGFRSPNIRELYMYAPRNPNLRPESMDNFEIELRQGLLAGRLDLGLALYYINGDNMIQTVSVDGSPRNVNTGKFINKGVEFDASFTVLPRLTLAASYAYLHTDTRIVGAPRHKLFGEISYSPGNWEFSLDAMGIWHLYTENSVENYALLNARAAYRFDFRKPVTLFVKGDNLTATKYQINYGFPMPRATVMAGVEWKF